jgi:hypothetical protein
MNPKTVLLDSVDDAGAKMTAEEEKELAELLDDE